MSRWFALVAVAALLVVAEGCGSGGAAVQNVQPITVFAGPANDYFNGAFTSVIVCAPGSTTACQTIDGILVDTGSSGLRVLASALSVALPRQTGTGGNAIVECFPFEDGFTWGSVETADVTLAGEQARALPLQVIGDPTFSTVPVGWTSFGLTSENTLADLGANGILGVGVFRQDCGSGCSMAGASNPGVYFACPSSGSGCTPTVESLSNQLQNPVWLFPQDNNGVLIDLPSVPASGSLVAVGSLIFGIGTQSDNGLGSAKVLTTDFDGTMTTIFNGTSYGESFIDSGSNGFFFLDSPTTKLALCPDSPDFYCPVTPQTLSATNRGANGSLSAVTFTISNADALSQTFTAFSTVGGPNPGSFDWGLPFFYGRLVFTAIEGQNTPGGMGPYWAY